MGDFHKATGRGRDTGRVNLRQKEKYLFHLDKRKRSKDEYIKRQVCRLKMKEKRSNSHLCCSQQRMGVESCEEAGGGLTQLSCGDGGIWTGRAGGRAEDLPNLNTRHA